MWRNRKRALLTVGVLILALLLATIFAGLSVWRMVQVNRKYPQAQLIRIRPGKDYEIEKQLFMRVTGSTRLSRAECIRKYGKSFPEEMAVKEEGDFQAIAVKIHLENTSEKDTGISASTIRIENNSYSNGLVPDYYGFLNDDWNQQIRVPAGKGTDVTLGYFLFRFQFSEKQWENIRRTPLYLVDHVYPQRIYWSVD